jgi:hypothetical protein
MEGARARDGASWIKSSITYIITDSYLLSALPTAHPKAHCLVVFGRLIKVQIRGVDGLRQRLLTRLPLKTPSSGVLPSDEDKVLTLDLDRDSRPRPVISNTTSPHSILIFIAAPTLLAKYDDLPN